jgi:hypothetical protein
MVSTGGIKTQVEEELKIAGFIMDILILENRRLTSALQLGLVLMMVLPRT